MWAFSVASDSRRKTSGRWSRFRQVVVVHGFLTAWNFTGGGGGARGGISGCYRQVVVKTCLTEC